MTPPPVHPQKRQTLRRHGTLNPHPEAVSHPLFHNSDFFDSDDLVQVKYEMLRQVHVDNRLLDLYTYPDVASKLNQSGMTSGEGNPFTARIVAGIQRRYGLRSRYDRLRTAGLLTLQEIAKVLDLSTTRVKIWLRHGLLRGHAYNNSNACLYEHPGENPPRKAMGVKLSKRAVSGEIVPQRIEEVQCEA